MDAVLLILSDARGIYIPRDFVTDSYNEIATEHCEKWGISPSDAAVLRDPENEFYWDTWDFVLQTAEYKTEGGDIYRLMQDGDLWGYCFEKMTDAEKENFGFDVY